MSKKSLPAVPNAAKSRPSGVERRQPRDRDRSATAGESHGFFSAAAIRETIESVVIAFVLAFLFRTFEAEAFVIPTGSMAPTLMGRHKDLTCPSCGYQYQVSASDEVQDAESGVANGPPVEGATCPMCRFPMYLGWGPEAQKEYPSFKGDRILVNKFWYQFTEPKRWDVAVFKYPGGAKTNFIKRVVGLPGETVRIFRGDIYAQGPGQNGFSIARKPPAKLLAMLQPVFDNDRMSEIAKYGWPLRWTPWPSAEGNGGGTWVNSEDYRVFETDGAGKGENWIRYEHRVATEEQWRKYQQTKRALPPEELPKPQLISDFTAYNTSRTAMARTPEPEYHWVSDLAVSADVEVQSDTGVLIFELVKGGQRAQARLDVASGEAVLSIVGLEGYHPTAQTRVRGAGKHTVMFSNVDAELRLWVDGKVVEFDRETSYDPPARLRPTEEDLAPAGIASQGAAVRISRLNLLRDIYYIAHATPDQPFSDFGTMRVTSLMLHDALSDPKLWGIYDDPQALTYELKADPANPQGDQFLVLGDNSAKSKDSRLWETEHYVVRRLMIGKALFIYWPHSWDRVPGTNIPFPLFPNFSRMGFVR